MARAAQRGQRRRPARRGARPTSASSRCGGIALLQARARAARAPGCARARPRGRGSGRRCAGWRACARPRPSSGPARCSRARKARIRRWSTSAGAGSRPSSSRDMVLDELLEVVAVGADGVRARRCARDRGGGGRRRSPPARRSLAERGRSARGARLQPVARRAPGTRSRLSRARCGQGQAPAAPCRGSRCGSSGSRPKAMFVGW